MGRGVVKDVQDLSTYFMDALFQQLKISYFITYLLGFEDLLKRIADVIFIPSSKP